MATSVLTATELAIFGGAPALAEPRHVGAPNLCDRTRLYARFDALLDRARLTNRGPFVCEFERRVAERMGVRHCIAMSNGTQALEIAIRALGMRGEVIVPAFTFVATAHALRWQRIDPVFCDIDPRTHNLDPAAVERLITPRMSGIVGVHLWGRPCAVDDLALVARRHDLPLLYDAAHAFNVTAGGRPLGRFGAAQVLSFHATKFLNTAEGGAVITDDDALAEKIRLMQNFGFAGLDNVIYVGTNGKMNEFSAALGLTGLEEIDAVVARNRANHERYRSRLADLPGLTLLAYDERDDPNYQYVVVEVDAAAAGLSRDELVAVLRTENVLARRYFYPGCHRMEPYRSDPRYADLQLPATDRTAARVMTLPTGTAVSAADIDRIAEVMERILTRAPEIRAFVAERGGMPAVKGRPA